MKKVNSPSESIINSLLATILVGIYFLFPAADADLGWHLRYGEILIKTGKLVRQNIFSFVMPDYQWVNHSWLYDPLVSLLFRWGGFISLTISGALLICLSFYLISRKLENFALLTATLIYCFFGFHLLSIGLRSQLFSLLFCAYLWTRLKNFKGSILWDIPILFLIWSNLHGQFIMGLGILWLYIVGFYISTPQLINTPKLKSYFKNLVIIGVTSSVVVLINPYGVSLIQTTIHHLISPITVNIYEWMPWELHSYRMYALLLYSLAVLFTLLKWQVKQNRWVNIFVYIPLLVLSLKARRIIPFFILITLEDTSLYISSLMPKLIRLTPQITRLILIASFLLISIFILPDRSLLQQSWDTYCHTNIQCSENLISYLETHPLKAGHILNAYRLGGHLIYRYQESKVFIDGRMTLWQDAQGKYPFQDYLDMIHGRANAHNLLDKYAIRYVIAHPEFALMSQLENLWGWHKIYADETVMILESPQQ